MGEKRIENEILDICICGRGSGFSGSSTAVH